MQEQIEAYGKSASASIGEISGVVDGSQREANRLITPAVRAVMGEVYEECLRNTGKLVTPAGANEELPNEGRSLTLLDCACE